MHVIVTGHRGYIGTAMVPILQSAGHTVRGIDTDYYRRCSYGDLPEQCPGIERDVRDIEPSDLEGADAIVHLAALSNDVLGDIDQELTYDINHRSSVRLADMAKTMGIKRYVFASSCSMYGASGDIGDEIPILDESADFNPVTAYAKSKVFVERDVRELADDSFSPTFMRNATAFGYSPRMRFDIVVNNLAAWAYTTGKVMMKSDGTPWRPLVHINDISQAVVAVLATAREVVHNESYNVGRDEENYQVRDVATMVREAVGDCELSFADGAEPDIRNYRVSFAKYGKTFSEFPLKWTVRTGIESIVAHYKKFGLVLEEYEGARFRRITQLQELMANGALNEELRWNAQR